MGLLPYGRTGIGAGGRRHPAASRANLRNKGPHALDHVLDADSFLGVGSRDVPHSGRLHSRSAAARSRSHFDKDFLGHKGSLLIAEATT